MKNIPLLLATLIGTVALIIGVAVTFSNQSSSTKIADESQLAGDKRRIKGPENAKVTIVEFSDFQCGGCAAAYPIIKQVQAANPDQVAVIYRHYPLTQIHPYAQLAAQAAEAAGEQGKFWEMHDRLFDQQTTWAALRSQDDVLALFSEYAQEFGIDKNAFMEKIQLDQVKQNVADDVSSGTRLNVDSTPTIYLNGQKVTAPAQLSQLVADLLKTE